MEFGASVTPPGFGLRREIDRIVGDAFTRKPPDRRRSSPGPSMEMRETDRELTLIVEVPDAGVAAIDITVHDGVLTVCERIQSAAAERRESSFQHSVQLPKDADEQGIVSHIDAGVLIVRIPKVHASAINHHTALPQPALSSATTSLVAVSD